MYGATYELLAGVTRQILKGTNQFSGLYQGKGGELFFLAHVQQHFPHMVDEAHLQTYFSSVIDSSQSLLSDLSLSDGITGIAYLIEYLSAQQPELSELNDSFDIYLESALSHGLAVNEFELTRGLAGLLVYLQARRDTVHSQRIAEIILQRLEAQAVWMDNLCAWSTHSSSAFRLQNSTTELEFNLGLAHGVPGVITSLLPWIQDPQFGSRVKQLVCGGCDWLIHQRQQPDSFGSFYPDIVNSRVRSRLGWCYGDLTIALLLGRVSQLCHCPRYYAIGNEIALFSSKRRGVSSLVENPALCHGSAGVSILFQLLSYIYPQQELKAAADYWFDFTLKHPQVTLLLDAESPNALLSNGLVNGYSGIGLAMISRITSQTSWAGCLCLE